MNASSHDPDTRLPVVFTLADLKQQLPGDEHAAMALALRWLESGQVRQVAPPRPVFIRLGSGETPAEADLCLALRRAFPSLVVVGGSALAPGHQPRAGRGAGLRGQ